MRSPTTVRVKHTAYRVVGGDVRATVTYEDIPRDQWERWRPVNGVVGVSHVDGADRWELDVSGGTPPPEPEQ